MDPGKFLLFFVGGLAEAAVLFIVAVGLSLIFGSLRVINMAHGSLYMIAAFATTAVIAFAVGAQWGFWAALLVAPLIAALIGAVIEITVLKRVYGEEHLLQLLGTYALTLVFAGLVRQVFGADVRSVSSPALISGSFQLGIYRYSFYDLFLISAAVVISVALYLLMNRTRLGRSIRAAVSDPELLAASGVNVSRLYTTVFMIGAFLAGLGGVLVAPSQAVSPDMDTGVLVLAFAISVIGGLGSLVGSLAGAVIVGMVLSFGSVNQFTTRYSLAFVFVVMAVVLVIRPWGLFGQRES